MVTMNISLLQCYYSGIPAVASKLVGRYVRRQAEKKSVV